ncbi:MAG: ribonuclease P protein component [Clostridia bacterium]|nr:ribonuclease P protein component [Clostridia bacterium]
MADKITTLNRNTDFRRTYGRGKVFTNPALVSYVTKNRAGICRIGITTSKKIGNAVERNRSRRVIRAAYRAAAPQVQGGWDIVFVARSKTKTLKSTQLEPILLKHLKQAGVIPS